MRNLFLYLVFILFPLINSCDKEAVIGEKDYPYIITNAISDITDSSVVFNGEIISTGSSEIIEYGFLWDTDEPKVETANKVVINTNVNLGTFSIKIDYNLFKDSEQIVRSYLKTNNLVVYGNQIKFTCHGGVPAIISEIYPLKGYVNSQVVIIGDNFTNQKDNVSVFFEDIEAIIDSCSDNRIVVRVPDFDEDSEVNIKISVYNKTTILDNKFKVFTYWKKIANFPGTERFGPTSFSIDNMGYVGLGNQYYGDYYNDFYKYNPQSNSWNKIADFPGEARKYAIGFSYKGKGYVGFGYANNYYYHDLWEYDPNTDIWLKVTENENIITYEDAYFLIEEELFIVTQYGVYKLNLENMTFSDLGYFTGKYRFFTSGFSIDDKGYLFAGQQPGNKYMKDLWEYDSKENTWTELSELVGSEYRDSPVSFSLGERLFMGMGGFIDAYNDIFEYDIINRKWYKLENLPGEGRSHATSFTIGDKAYIGTGYDEYIYQFSDFYEFNPNKE